MLPQSKQMIPNFSVQELIAFGRSPYKKFFEKRRCSEDIEIINWAMEVTGTSKHASRMFSTLSGGEQQKVRIAMTLAQKTTVLLLDEPTTYLDIAHQLDVMEIMQELNHIHGMTIVMVLHELQQAATYSDYLIAMKNGKVAVQGKPKDILTSEFLKDVYNIEATVKYEDHYPMIIPAKRKIQQGKFNKTKINI